MIESAVAIHPFCPSNRWIAAFLGWLGLCLILLPSQPAMADETKLPLPRFASLQSNEVNLRAGPDSGKPILWVYQRANMPVEIIEEFDVWRRIRDHEGVVGWVKGSLLSGKRTGIVTDLRRTLRKQPEDTAPAIALLDPGVIGRILECDGAWCRFEVQGYKGWLKREEFWGVYPDEVVKE